MKHVRESKMKRINLQVISSFIRSLLIWKSSNRCSRDRRDTIGQMTFLWLL
uniref:Uncharacterized protein n=1 Tax=Octopus bimaculoides TaxID=37653 RepID=A0A0L8GM95_OCTBM